MQFTMRQRPLRSFAVRAVLVLGLGLLLGFAGPFSGQPPLARPLRYAFWLGMTTAGYALLLAAVRLLPSPDRWRPELRLSAAAILSALPLTFVAAWAISLLRPGHLYQPQQLPALFMAVALVQLVVAFLLLRQPPVSPAQPSEPTARAPSELSSALLSRLPQRLGRQVVALEAEDHYVRVHTALGSELVLIRLADAITALPPGLGLQVHRSWWVALPEIREAVRSDQRLQLRLANGALVPVGRTYAAEVRRQLARLPVDQLA